MQGGERHPIPVAALIGEQGAGLELVCLGEPAVVVERPGRLTVVPPHQHLRQRRPSGPMFGGDRVGHDGMDLRQRRPQFPQPNRCRAPGCPPRVLDEPGESLAARDEQPDRSWPGQTLAEAFPFDLTQPGERGSEQGPEQDPS